MDWIDGWWMGAWTCASATELSALARRAGGWSQLEPCSEAELVALGVAPDKAAAWIRTEGARTQGTALVRSDARYPSSLQTDDRAPAVLCVEGDLGLLDAGRSRVAIVGTRRCTGGGRALARRLGRELAERGTVVVSGLALGIDAAAHQGALDAGSGRTIAVLAHGLAMTAPASHRRLRARIVDQGGLILSSWPDPTRPERWTFPARNRWIAGLADPTVVVEAPTRSGALITARDALALGRDVWVVPGRSDQPEAAGGLALLEEQTERLHHDSALRDQQLREALDLFASGDRADGVLGRLRTASRAGPHPRVRVLSDVAGFVAEVTGHAIEPEAPWLARLLSGQRLEEVARAVNRPIAELIREIGRRELAGELVRLPGGRYGRAARVK